MKRYSYGWQIAAATTVLLLHCSCALLPRVPLGNFTFSTAPIGIEHFNIGVRGILGSSKLKSVVIASVRAGSPVSEAGILSGDGLLSVDSVQIRTLSFDQFRALLATFKQGLAEKRIAFEVISPGAATSRTAIVVIPAAVPGRPRELAGVGSCEQMRPNKAPDPTSLRVTPRARARVAPLRAVAHL